MKKTLTIAAVAIVTATGAFAKGHDQGAGPNGSPATPAGQNAGSETAAAAQTLGKGQGNTNTDRGNSGTANAQEE